MTTPDPFEQLLSQAVHHATDAGAEAIEPLHLFIALCTLTDAAIVSALPDGHTLAERGRGFAREQVQPKHDRPERVSGRVMRVLDRARQEATASKRPLDAIHILVALLEQPDSILRKFLEREHIDAPAIANKLRTPTILTPAVAPTTPPAQRGKHPESPTVDAYGRDYTALARAGKLEPVVGRRDEIKQIVRILLRKGKNNAVLLGEPGVGKTAIVEALAQRIVADEAPTEIRDLRIVELMMSTLLAGAEYRGIFEERLQRIIREAEADPNLILFIDEIHTLVGAGLVKNSSLDAANMLKPALARGTLRCIGATTPAEYRQHIEKDAALERRFQPVTVDEPTPAETREILTGLRPSYEAHHHVKIGDDALDAAIELSVRYLPDRRLPDKARDLVDQAAVNCRILTLSPHAPAAAPATIGREEVARVIAEWTGVPVSRLTTDRRQQLIQMEATLRKRVVGQDEALAAVAQVVRTAMSGLARSGRPLGSFLFMGPTGVGKTELAKALAEFLFDDERHLARFDMSEYMEEHSVSKLIGAPPGYVGHDEGGTLTDAVRRTPYCVVLFDEIEKAHPRILDILLQLLDDGRLTDSKGRRTDFSNTLVVMTSNLGAGRATMLPKGGGLGFRAGKAEPREVPAAPDDRALLVERLRPEFVNRIGQVLRFRPLGADDLRRIIDKIIADIRRRLTEQQVTLDLAPQAYDVLIELAHRTEFGARELERIVDAHVVQPLARGLLDGTFNRGDRVRVDGDGDRLKLAADAKLA